MAAYSVTGPSGTGKSTVGRVLQQRGFRVIETDFEDGLSGWFNNDSGRPATAIPPQPYPKAWVDTHSWCWEETRMNELLASVKNDPVFFCGGAFNEKDFFGSFKLRFGLCVSNESLVTRLQEREPTRWQDGSIELQKQLAWNSRFRDYCQRTGVVVIDSSVSPEAVADSILRCVQD
jgi:hypothetical protein